MVRGLAATHRALEHQRELLAQPGLADELGQLPGPERALDLPLVSIGQRRDEPVRVRHVRPRTLRAARRATATSTSAVCSPLVLLRSGSTIAIACSASLACQPRLTRPVRTWSFQVSMPARDVVPTAPAVLAVARPGPEGGSSGEPSRPASSS